MREQKVTYIKRIVFLSVIVLAAVLLIIVNHELKHGANYAIGHTPASELPSHPGSDETITGIEEPDGLNQVIRLTFGGNCTPAAILGADSFGTFNNTAAEEGRELFFSKLNRVFREDDCTFLGCAAVLSDRELSF
ncbi:MAG: hypothetical protein E7638_04815, partial [Ruminococcaceae bacterium]|nr:hypothetical protein [Oscillospiraceae bacterium]